MSAFTRRQAFGFLGGAGAAYLIGRGLRAQDLLGQGAAEAATGSATCVLTPAKTEGPYFVDEMLKRSDIRSDPSDGSVEAGVPLTLTIVVLRADASCAPVAGAQVDVWHSSAAGLYSDEAANGTSGQKFLRGYQVTDGNGSVTFKTIYPGWYTGRTIHIHFKVRTFQSAQQTYEFTSQLFFDDAVSDQVMAKSPYSSRGARDTRNSDDGIYDGNGATLTPVLSGDPSSGYTATFNAGLSGLPASGGGDASVHADLQAASFEHDEAGGRSLSLKLKVNEQVSADAQLRRGGRLLAHKRKARLAAGTRTIEVPIGGRVEAGAAALKLALEDAAGNTRVVRRQLRIPGAG